MMTLLYAYTTKSERASREAAYCETSGVRIKQEDANRKVFAFGFQDQHGILPLNPL